jgi:hypothetical protein
MVTGNYDEKNQTSGITAQHSMSPAVPQECNVIELMYV